MYKKGQTNPEKFQDWTQHSCCSMLTLEFFWKLQEATNIVPSPKVVCSLSNHHACCEKLWFVRSLYPNLPQMGQNFHHSMLMPLHDSMPSFMNFIRVLDLLEFKKQVPQRFASNQQCPGVWNSFPSLAWDLEIHPRTHMWFFKQLWCIGACACSSNLNYAHKMPRKPS